MASIARRALNGEKAKLFGLAVLAIAALAAFCVLILVDAAARLIAELFGLKMKTSLFEFIAISPHFRRAQQDTRRAVGRQSRANPRAEAVRSFRKQV